MTDALGVAVLGAGRMGQTHIRNLAGMPDVRLVAVADPDPARAEEGRTVGRALRAFTDPYQAIRDPEVDAVVIVTPTSTHAELVEAALSAGKPIWTEKPIALDLIASRRVAELARSTGVPVQVGFMRRFDPAYARAKQRIEAGEVGRIEQFRALGRDTYPPPLEFLRTSGGVFLDMAVHDFDLARFLVGEVEEVHAWGAVLTDDRFTAAGDVDTAITLLRFASGALGVVETARHSAWGYDIRTEVAGALGKLVVEAHRKTDLTFSREFGYEGDHYQNFPDRFATAFRLELEAFVRSVVAGTAVSPGPDEAHETLRLAVAATHSWREGRPVRVADVQEEMP
jgi:myo-inositol 2-dehydrogenase/D-chiro-inositol 1-dehydrogenase